MGARLKTLRSPCLRMMAECAAGGTPALRHSGQAKVPLFRRERLDMSRMRTLTMGSGLRVSYGSQPLLWRCHSIPTSPPPQATTGRMALKPNTLPCIQLPVEPYVFEPGRYNGLRRVREV